MRFLVAAIKLNFVNELNTDSAEHWADHAKGCTALHAGSSHVLRIMELSNWILAWVAFGKWLFFPLGLV